MTRLQSMRCPECNAVLSEDNSGKPIMFCSYCGARLLVENDSETVYRHVDEAEVIRAKTEQAVKMKELEFLDQQQAEIRQELNRLKQYFRAAAIAAAIIGFILIVLISTNKGSDTIGPWLLIIEGILIALIVRIKKRMNKFER